MRIVCLSDTHNSLPDLEVPDGDLLLHGGDHSRRGTLEEVSSSADWLGALPHPHKVLIGGNHDFCLHGRGHHGRDLFAGMTYLEDEGVEIEGLRIYGSPWTPEYGEWAFQAARGSAMAAVWQRIPSNTQLLITHGPPYGIADMTVRGVRAGCEALLERVREIKPLLHLFGHIHEGYGVHSTDGTIAVNGSSCALGYLYPQPPHVFDWDGRAFHRVTQWTPSQPLWEFLLQRCGPPRSLRGRSATEWDDEFESEYAFWLEERGDGEGAGEVLFYPCSPGDGPTDSPADGRARRWPFSFGVKLPTHWFVALNDNPWHRLSEVPRLNGA